MAVVKINGVEKQYPKGTTYETIVQEYQQDFDGLIALVAVDGKIRELFKKVSGDCELSFFTLRDAVGYKTYVRSVTMLFMKSVYDFSARNVQESAGWSLPSVTVIISVLKT